MNALAATIAPFAMLNTRVAAGRVEAVNKSRRELLAPSPWRSSKPHDTEPRQWCVPAVDRGRYRSPTVVGVPITRRHRQSNKLIDQSTCLAVGGDGWWRPLNAWRGGNIETRRNGRGKRIYL